MIPENLEKYNIKDNINPEDMMVEGERVEVHQKINNYPNTPFELMNGETPSRTEIRDSYWENSIRSLEERL